MTKTPKVSIGLPVYNGECQLNDRINSIFSQTFTDFELIISDNASTDSTSLICKKIAEQDRRVKYFRQDKNIGHWRNFQFVLKQATGDYFIWAAVDDVWLPNFLEKNVTFLNSNENYVGSISKIQYFEEDDPPKLFEENKQYHTRSNYDTYPKTKNYYDRVDFYLKFRTSENLYALFRTNILKKNNVKKRHTEHDRAIILYTMKFGEINIINEILMYRSDEGLSTSLSGIERVLKNTDYGILGKIFPFMPFTFWFMRTMGFNAFMRNISYFFKTNCDYEKQLLRYLKFKLLRTSEVDESLKYQKEGLVYLTNSLLINIREIKENIEIIKKDLVKLDTINNSELKNEILSVMEHNKSLTQNNLEILTRLAEIEKTIHELENKKQKRIDVKS